MGIYCLIKQMKKIVKTKSQVLFLLVKFCYILYK